jgi:hypothetical protein
MHGPVIHLLSFPGNGHVLHTSALKAYDCWCEPNRLTWVLNDNNVYVLIVEHNDYTAMHRRLQLAERAAGRPEHLAWIDRALDNIHSAQETDNGE